MSEKISDIQYREWVERYARKLGWTVKQAYRYLATGKRPKNKLPKRNGTSSRTSTSTKARTTGNVTVTGGAGRGATTTVRIRRNPGGRTMIYGRVLRINAQKTQKHICDAECKRAAHRYFHEFKSGAVMYGLPNGDILITKRGR